MTTPTKTNRSTAKTSDNTSLLSANTFFQIAVGSFSALAIFCTGCAMCCGPYDYHYPNHGGTVQRADPVWGRVGSIFSDPGPFGGPGADYNLTPHDETLPLSDDEINSLEPIPGDDNGFDPTEEMLDNGNLGNENGELPPPRNEERPSPDDSTNIRRLRNQSNGGRSRWR